MPDEPNIKLKENKPAKRNPWFWIPSLYFAEGVPYVVVMTVSVIMYKRLGISNTDIALYTSWLYLPWVIKPLWSPLIDILRTKRFWIVTMQLIVGAGLAGVALTIPVPNFFQYTLAFFWLLAFSSATHDIAADGFYMLGLNEHDQAWFVGIRSTFYRVAMIFGQGLLIILAGYIESHSGLPTVDINALSQPGKSITQIVSPNQISFTSLRNNLSSNSPNQIITLPDTLLICTKPLPKAEADSIKNMAKDWNVSKGFYKEETKKSAVVSSNNESWWDKIIANNLAAFLKKYFGPTKKTFVRTDNAGNIGVIYFELAKKPPEGKNIVINFGRESGDQSISLVEGKRFTFNSTNWNKPAMAVIQLDPKLKYETSALFRARAGNIPLAWIITFFFVAVLFILFCVYHKFILPRPKNDVSTIENLNENPLQEFFRTFALFFTKEKIGIMLAFVLLYRLGEAQLVKLATPFFLDAQEVGGLALTTGQVGFIYGTVGVLALTLGGILGGILAARDGMKRWIWWMLVAINIPDLVYVFLSYTQTTNMFLINLGVAFEQFGYGFGFTAFMLYLIYISEGDHKTSHYAISTGFMALGMMIPGMFSGWLQSIIGYQHFFIWVCISTIPIFFITKFIPLNPEFGKKTETE
jgi:MFS transporter, PAT family, beta-lactamase induction signal transducer AmpG